VLKNIVAMIAPSGCCEANTNFNWIQWHFSNIVGIICLPNCIILRVNEIRNGKPSLITKKKNIYIGFEPLEKLPLSGFAFKFYLSIFRQD
jgi:hypothetical protein